MITFVEIVHTILYFFYLIPVFLILAILTIPHHLNQLIHNLKKTQCFITLLGRSNTITRNKISFIENSTNLAKFHMEFCIRHS